MLLILFFAMGCSDAALDPDVNADDETDGKEEITINDLEPIEMTFAHADIADPDQYVHACAVAFKEYVEKESNGKITVNISSGGELGNTAALQEMTMSGEIEASTSHTEGTMAIVYPNIQALSIPYLFDTVEQAFEVFEGEYGERMFEDMRAKTGLRVIGFFDNGGMRHYLNNVRPIKTPADMEGLRIRTMDNPAHMEIVRQLGASPIPISWAEVYTALDTGVVDGMEIPLPVIIIGSIQEVIKYCTLDGHVYNQMHVLINDEWFLSLQEPYQEIVLAGGEYSALRAREVVKKTLDESIDFLTPYMEIYQPTPQEIALFREATQEPVVLFVKEQVDDPAWVEEILVLAEETRN